MNIRDTYWQSNSEDAAELDHAVVTYVPLKKKKNYGWLQVLMSVADIPDLPSLCSPKQYNNVLR